MQHTINGVRMHWNEAGSGDPLIFIHGFPFNSTLWSKQFEAPPEGWRFIAPDLRGFGQSEAGQAGSYSMDLFADDINALLDHLGFDQAVICGQSMGGYVALSLARRYPDRVRALVLMATRASADSEEGARNRRALAARARSEGVKPVIDAMLPKLVSAHSRMKQPEIVDFVRAMMEATLPETMARALEGMAERHDYTGELDQIDVSTMVVRGDQDEIVPAVDMEFIARTVRGARSEVISLAGHLPNLEASDVTNNLLNRFLALLPPALKLGGFSFSL